MRLFLDVESVPSQLPGEFDRILAGLKPPGTLKKAESIAQWWAEEAPKAAEEEYRRQALDPAAGELVAIGCATDDGDPTVFMRLPGESEAGLLRDFYAHIQQLLDDATMTDAGGRSLFVPEPFCIGHNIAFDLSFLRARSWIHNVKPSFRLPPADAWPGKTFGCTMNLWAGRTGRISLDRLCRALGIPSPKGEVDGSKIFDLWCNGKLDVVREYCAADVLAVRGCWQRMNWEAAA